MNYLTDMTPNADVMPACEWSINETALPDGDFLLYRAAKCGAKKSSLELSIGAKSAELNIAQSAYGEGTSWKVADISPQNAANTALSIIGYATNYMQDKSDFLKCAPRLAGSERGFPRGAYVVDYNAQSKAALPKEEDDLPYMACGEKGVNEQSHSYWIELGEYLAFYDLGDEAWWDIDPASVTIIKATDLPR